MSAPGIDQMLALAVGGERAGETREDESAVSRALQDGREVLETTLTVGHGGRLPAGRGRVSSPGSEPGGRSRPAGGGGPAGRRGGRGAGPRAGACGPEPDPRRPGAGPAGCRGTFHLLSQANFAVMDTVLERVGTQFQEQNPQAQVTVSLVPYNELPVKMEGDGRRWGRAGWLLPLPPLLARVDAA